MYSVACVFQIKFFCERAQVEGNPRNSVRRVQAAEHVTYQLLCLYQLQRAQASGLLDSLVKILSLSAVVYSSRTKQASQATAC